MPPDFPWLAAAFILAAVAWAVPRLLNQIKRFVLWSLHVLGDHIRAGLLADIEAQLAPSWSADFDDALDPIWQEVSAILLELTVNGGTSVKDKVNVIATNVHQLQKDIEPLLVEHKRRFDPPDGSPV